MQRKRAGGSPVSKVIECALGGSRTHNHLIRSQALYPLSYEGVNQANLTGYYEVLRAF